MYATEKVRQARKTRRNSIRDKFMDADDTVSEVNDRFEDAVGFRFHEDVRATIIFEQLVKEHGRAKVLRAFDGFLEEFPNPFEAETALHEFTTNFKRYSK
jgi:hypothetical protein